jgi:hemerythrin-like domain-containing protein
MKDRLTPDLRMSYLEHRAMRVDAARLAALVAAARPDDTARLRALARWYTGYEGAIHDHHRTEEVVIYPALLERDPSFADADAELEGQHSVLIDRLTVARESLGSLAAGAGGSRWEVDRDDAARAVRELKVILDTHIHDEEAVAFPRYSAAFTGAEFDELARAAWKVVGARAVVFAGPWVLDHGTAAERAELLAEQPLLMRVLYRLALRPRYERLARPLRRDHTSVRTRTES